MTHCSSGCPGKPLARRTAAAVVWLPLVAPLLLFLTPRQMDRSNKMAPTATSTMATVEDLPGSVSSASLSMGAEELSAGVMVEPPDSPSMGTTVHTIMTMPRAMSPNPRAHRA